MTHPTPVGGRSAERAAIALSRDDPITLMARHTLARVLFKSGQVDEARDLLAHVLAAAEVLSVLEVRTAP